MQKSLFSNNQKRYFWAITEYAWYPFLLFLSTRYFIEYLGSEKYGIWMFLTAIVASTSILNVGISGAVIKVVSAELGCGVSSKVIESIANTAFGIALASGTLTTFIIMIIALAGWHSSAMDQANLYPIAATVTVLIFLEYVDIACSSMLKGGEHFLETARIEVLFKTVQTVASLAVVVIWSDLLPLYAVLVLVNIVRVTIKMLRMKQVYGIQRIRPAFNSFSQLMIFAKWGWLHGMGGFMLATVDRLLVGYLMGPEALAYYSLLLMIPQQIHALAGAALSVTFPRISSLLSSRRTEEVEAMKAKITRVTVMIGAIPSLLLIMFPEAIFGLWLGKELPPDAMAALRPMVLAFFLLCLNVPPYYTLLGMGQVRYVAIVNLIAGIASMITLALLLRSGGLYIAAVSKLVYATILLVQFYRVNQGMTQLMRNESK